MKTKQALNPYMASWEYVPDAEPDIVGDRVYVYGSHDTFNGINFCLGDYVCWSAPVDDLGNWRYEGEIYKRSQDPAGKYEFYGYVSYQDGTPIGKKNEPFQFDPGCLKDNDGRLYMYTGFAFGGSKPTVDGPMVFEIDTKDMKTVLTGPEYGEFPSALQRGKPS